MFDKAMKFCHCGKPLTSWVVMEKSEILVVHGDDHEHPLRIDLEYTEKFRAQAITAWLSGYHQTGRGNAHNDDSPEYEPGLVSPYRFNRATATTTAEQE